jgi:hypothetical protein
MRITKEIEIEGKRAFALFDTGALHTYIREEFLIGVPKRIIPVPYKVGLGGKEIEIRESCVAIGKIEGLVFDTEAIPIDELGKVDGHRLDVIIGALTMEKWEIKLDPRTGELGLDGLRRREFREYREKNVRKVCASM